MTALAIAVRVQSGVARAHATLAALRVNCGRPFRLLLVPDGPDPEMLAALREMREPQLSTPDTRGPGDCFARVVATAATPLVAFLEAGALVSPGWLDRLEAVLDRDGVALAGPSTNCGAQAIACDGNPSAVAIARQAKQLAARVGDAVVPVVPPAALDGFCVVGRRDVLAEVGVPTTATWAADLNARLAASGKASVWVQGAFVYQHGPIPQIVRSRPRPPAPAPAPVPRREPPPRPSATVVVPREVGSSRTRVACIMPTRDRRAFVPSAIACFVGQDHAERELIVLDDGADPVRDLIPHDPRIRYVRLDGPPRSIGAKRNLACEYAADADVIAHWDDDDWYPSWRLRAQVDAIAGGADICGTSRLYYVDRERTRAWQYAYGGGEPFVGGNTLAYRRRVWESNRFADVSIGEDVRFLRSRGRATVRDLANSGLCIATLHDANTSPKSTNNSWWTTTSIEIVNALFAADDPRPLVSCIMPTANRRAFISVALSSWAAQSYPNRELVIVDDGDQPVADLVEHLPRVRYIRLPQRVSIGEKRNIACRAAQGTIIAQWDDDDFYAPDRLAYQCEPIIAGNADITGLENRYVLQLPDEQFWTTTTHLHRRMFVGDVHGGTLVYRRAIVERGSRYPHTSLAEDAMFLRSTIARGARLLRLDNDGVFIYVRHGRNAWRFEAGSFIDARSWSRVDAPSQFTPDWLHAYRAAYSNFAAT